MQVENILNMLRAGTELFDCISVISMSFHFEHNLFQAESMSYKEPMKLLLFENNCVAFLSPQRNFSSSAALQMLLECANSLLSTKLKRSVLIPIGLALERASTEEDCPLLSHDVALFSKMLKKVPSKLSSAAINSLVPLLRLSISSGDSQTITSIVRAIEHIVTAHGKYLTERNYNQILLSCQRCFDLDVDLLGLLACVADYNCSDAIVHIYKSLPRYILQKRFELKSSKRMETPIQRQTQIYEINYQIAIRKSKGDLSDLKGGRIVNESDILSIEEQEIVGLIQPLCSPGSLCIEFFLESFSSLVVENYDDKLVLILMILMRPLSYERVQSSLRILLFSNLIFNENNVFEKDINERENQIRNFVVDSIVQCWPRFSIDFIEFFSASEFVVADFFFRISNITQREQFEYVLYEESLPSVRNILNKLSNDESDNALLAWMSITSVISQTKLFESKIMVPIQIIHSIRTNSSISEKALEEAVFVIGNLNWPLEARNEICRIISRSDYFIQKEVLFSLMKQLNEKNMVNDGCIDFICNQIINSQYQLTEEEAFIFGESINNIDNRRRTLLMCLSGQQSPPPLFIIRNAVFAICFSLLPEKEMIQIFTKLIEFSASNAIVLEKVGFGGFLIDRISHQNFEEIPLLMSIITHHCSQETLSKLLAVTRKYPGKLLQPICLAVSSNSFPVLYECGTGQPCIRFKKNDLEKGFTFSCWIYYDAPVAEMCAAQPVILSIIAGGSIIIFLSGMSLFCQLSPTSSPGNDAASVCLSGHFPSNEWVLVNFTMIPKSEDNLHILFSLGTGNHTVCHTRNPNLRGKFHCMYGGVTDNSEGINFEDRSGPLALFSTFRMIPVTRRPNDIKEIFGAQRFFEAETIVNDSLRKILMDSDVTEILVASFEQGFLEDGIQLAAFGTVRWKYLFNEVSSSISPNIRIFKKFVDILRVHFDQALLDEIIFNTSLWLSGQDYLRILGLYTQVLEDFQGQLSRTVFERVLISLIGIEKWNEIEFQRRASLLITKMSADKQNMNTLIDILGALVDQAPQWDTVVSLSDIVGKNSEFIEDVKKPMLILIEILALCEPKSFGVALQSFLILCERKDQLIKLIEILEKSSPTAVVLDSILSLKNATEGVIIVSVLISGMLDDFTKIRSISDKINNSITKYHHWFLPFLKFIDSRRSGNLLLEALIKIETSIELKNLDEVISGLLLFKKPIYAQNIIQSCIKSSPEKSNILFKKLVRCTFFSTQNMLHSPGILFLLNEKERDYEIKEVHHLLQKKTILYHFHILIDDKGKMLYEEAACQCALKFGFNFEVINENLVKKLTDIAFVN